MIKFKIGKDKISTLTLTNGDSEHHAYYTVMVDRVVEANDTTITNSNGEALVAKYNPTGSEFTGESISI